MVLEALGSGRTWRFELCTPGIALENRLSVRSCQLLLLRYLPSLTASWLQIFTDLFRDFLEGLRLLASNQKTSVSAPWSSLLVEVHESDNLLNVSQLVRDSLVDRMEPLEG